MSTFQISPDLSSYLIAVGLLAIKHSRTPPDELPPELRKELDRLQFLVESEYFKQHLPQGM